MNAFMVLDIVLTIQATLNTFMMIWW